jgi:hypothetical protein
MQRSNLGEHTEARCRTRHRNAAPAMIRSSDFEKEEMACAALLRLLTHIRNRDQNAINGELRELGVEQGSIVEELLRWAVCELCDAVRSCAIIRNYGEDAMFEAFAAEMLQRLYQDGGRK